MTLEMNSCPAFNETHVSADVFLQQLTSRVISERDFHWNQTFVFWLQKGFRFLTKKKSPMSVSITACLWQTEAL